MKLAGQNIKIDVRIAYIVKRTTEYKKINEIKLPEKKNTA